MFSPSSLEDQIAKIEGAIKTFSHGKVTVTITLPINDDVPDNFYSISDENAFEKAIEAKNGEVTKKIVLNIPE